MQKSLFILLFCLISLPWLKAADIVVLKDGHGFNGEIKAIKNCTVKLQWNKDKLYIPLEEVEYIELKLILSDYLRKNRFESFAKLLF